jgi:hypothetical protein
VNAQGLADETSRSSVAGCALHLLRPLAVEGDDAGEGGFAALELPGEAADDQAAVLQRGVADVAARLAMCMQVLLNRLLCVNCWSAWRTVSPRAATPPSLGLAKAHTRRWFNSLA